MLKEMEFGIIDVETTGLFPGRNDKIVEIALVRSNSIGEIIGSYSTLINPNRDIGPTHIHGISARDIINAPTFREIAGDVLSLLAGTIIVGHNVSFDLKFIEAEFEQINCKMPDCPCLCTMQLAHRTDPSIPTRKLADICNYFKIPLRNAHSAQYDAEATLNLMITCFNLLGGSEKLTLADIGINRRPPVPETWPALPRSGLSYSRSSAVQDADSKPSYLESLVARLPNMSNSNPELDEYLSLLDRVLEDRRVTSEEFEEILSLANSLGISRENALSAHTLYMRDLILVALADDVITDFEKSDLQEVRKLLAISEMDYEKLLDDAKKQGIQNGKVDIASVMPKEEIVGKRICFTGEMRCHIKGQLAQRSYAEKLASENGMIVSKGVTKKLDYLVSADPDSMSGKAKKAREYGVRIIAESVFWRMLGVNIE